MLEFDLQIQDVPEGAQELLERVAQTACKNEGIERCGACLHLVNNEQIHALNRETRGVDRPTDVLSYPTVNYPAGTTAKDNKKRLLREKDPETGLCFLGDIFLSVERAREQADEYGHSLSREMGYLTAHAMLHLMGYDHMEEGERAVMREKEEAVMREIGLTREALPTDRELLEKACDMLEFSYAPYSKFRVGACLLCEDGRLFTGCNIENASYGATICAERTAVSKAVSEGARRFIAIAIAGDEGFPWPCGICRQVLNEFAPDIRVICGSRAGGMQVTTLRELLPHGFGPADLQ